MSPNGNLVSLLIKSRVPTESNFTAIPVSTERRMADSFNIVCAACRCAPGLWSDAHGEVVVCPNCRQRDSVDEAYRIARQHHSCPAAGFAHLPLTTQTFRWHSVPA